MAEEMKSMSLAELREEAKKRGLHGISTLKKQELLERLLMTEGATEQRPEKKPLPRADRQRTASEPRFIEPRADKPRTVAESVREPSAESVTEGRMPYRSGQEHRLGQEHRPGTEQRHAPEQRRMMPEGRQRYENRFAGSPNGAGMMRRQSMPNGSAAAPTQTAAPVQSGSTPTAQTVSAAQQYEQRPGENSGRETEVLDSGETKEGILEIMTDGFGFIRCDNYLPGENDVYVSPLQIRRFGLRTGDIITGNTKVRTATEKFSALLYIKTINGFSPAEAMKRNKFEALTPIFPTERIRLETQGCSTAMRMMDLISPIGKGQRGMIVAQPKTGKTTLLKQVAKSITKNHKDMHLIILLIDERPEEVTDIKESIEGDQVEVIYSTFDELPENHKRVSEMVIERAKRLVEHKKDVVILLDSITRLARAYNLTVQASGRTLSGGLDPAALHMPKRFFGAARNMREGGSLTILATALVETGSRMDDVVFEEFKGTGNMELVLNRNLSERRVFPAIDLPRSSTRREDLLLSPIELEAVTIMRRALNGIKSEEATERIISLFAQTRTNAEFIEMVKKTKLIN